MWVITLSKRHTCLHVVGVCNLRESGTSSKQTPLDVPCFQGAFLLSNFLEQDETRRLLDSFAWKHEKASAKVS